jgi:hypothetical protein
MGWNREVRNQIVKFLKDGQFDHAKEWVAPSPNKEKKSPSP